MADLSATRYCSDDIDGIDPPALLLYDADATDAWILSTAFIEFPAADGPTSTGI